MGQAETGGQPHQASMLAGGGIQMSGTAKAVQCLIKLGTTSLPRPIQMTEATGDLWSPFKIRGGPTTN